MPRPFSPAQQRQNRAFLAALARTGNARLAARAVDLHRATLTRRRASHPAFAADWDRNWACLCRTISRCWPR